MNFPDLRKKTMNLHDYYRKKDETRIKEEISDLHKTLVERDYYLIRDFFTLLIKKVISVNEMRYFIIRYSSKNRTRYHHFINEMKKMEVSIKKQWEEVLKNITPPDAGNFYYFHKTQYSTKKITEEVCHKELNRLIALPRNCEYRKILSIYRADKQFHHKLIIYKKLRGVHKNVYLNNVENANIYCYVHKMNKLMKCVPEKTVPTTPNSLTEHRTTLIYNMIRDERKEKRNERRKRYEKRKRKRVLTFCKQQPAKKKRKIEGNVVHTPTTPSIFIIPKHQPAKKKRKIEGNVVHTPTLPSIFIIPELVINSNNISSPIINQPPPLNKKYRTKIHIDYHKNMMDKFLKMKISNKNNSRRLINIQPPPPQNSIKTKKTKPIKIIYIDSDEEEEEEEELKSIMNTTVGTSPNLRPNPIKYDFSKQIWNLNTIPWTFVCNKE